MSTSPVASAVTFLAEASSTETGTVGWATRSANDREWKYWAQTVSQNEPSAASCLLNGQTIRDAPKHPGHRHTTAPHSTNTTTRPFSRDTASAPPIEAADAAVWTNVAKGFDGAIPAQSLKLDI